MPRYTAAELDGKVAVITGGGHGIGATIAVEFARAGARLTIAGRNEAALQTTAQEIEGLARDCEWVRADVTVLADVERVVTRTIDVFGRLDIVVNNAGISGPTTDLVDTSVEEWDRVLSTNLTSAFLFSKSAIPHMREAGGGRIVNIGSVLGKRPARGRTSYAASKLGLVGLTRSLAHEVGEYGITVNTISPWNVDGDRARRMIDLEAHARGVDSIQIQSEWNRTSPLGMGVTPEDVARLAVFLASDKSARITGEDINVSAGAVMY